VRVDTRRNCAPRGGARTSVIVNGTLVVENAAHTGATPGMVLRRRADGSVG
jgi:N-acyl-D-amino-acid deacylase